jgi:hypothetical protein
MSLRHCATKGCLGTLPIGRGKHCPRCGGTEFLPRRRRGRRVLLILIIALGVGTVFRYERKAPVSAVDRRRLEEMRDVAANMTETSVRDDAYAKILHQALAQHDFEYACELGGDMTGTDAKDKCLLETVEEALKAQQPAWAKTAAGEIVEISIRDEAFGKIMEAGRAMNN